MSYDDDYVSLELSKGSGDDQILPSTCANTAEQLVAAYSIIPDLRVLKPFSEKEARDMEEALRGDYKNYHERKNDIVQLPNSQSFQERLENSAFDKLNIESPALKYRFLEPFLLKAELSPVLAFSEVFLTFIHIITFISVLTNGMTAITMFIGGCSIFVLLSILHFWYGMPRYPSIWNRFVPVVLKGSTVDRNFKEIKDICGYHHNGHYRMNSQVAPFVITLPFTILFHANAFLFTAIHSLLRTMGFEKLPDPVISSIFLSNALITTLWFKCGTFGIVFATLTIYFNQKAYNSLLFKKNLKDFCISLVFGNLLLVGEKLTPGVTEIAKTAEYDIEEGTQKINTKSMADESIQQSRASLPPIRYLPPLLGASTSSTNNSFVDQDMATPENYSSPAPHNFSPLINDKIIVVQNGEEQVTTKDQEESPVETFVDETASYHSNEVLQHIATVNSTPKNLEQNAAPENEKGDHQNTKDTEKKLEHSKKTSRKGLFGLSRRMFSGSRTKHRRIENAEENQFYDEFSVEFLNPTDVHLDMENHIGTVEWRNTISESIQRFKIKSYTLRKHNWVMSKMHGKSFLVMENGNRRRKLKRREIKEYCKAFHDKQLHYNSQISGILGDLKDLRKNINHSKSNSISQSKSISEQTKFSFTNLPSQTTKHAEYFTMGDTKNQTPKSEGASLAKESLAGSKDSSVSTLTQSVVPPENPDDTRSGLCMSELTEKMLHSNDDASPFKETINGLLKCTPWVENINALKETASIEKTDNGENDLIDVQNTARNIDTSIGGKQLKCEGSENSLKNEIGNPNSDSNVTHQPCWPNYVDLREIFEKKSNEKPQEEKYPWRSDLQKKKIEKAQETRSQSKEIAANQPERVIPILKKATVASYSLNLKTAEDESRDQTIGDGSREMADSGRCCVDNRQSIHSVDHSNSRTLKISPVDDSPEMDTAPSHSGNKKMPGIDFGRECGAFAGVTDACSHLAVAEQREEDENFLSDVKLVSTNRIV